MCGLEPNRPGVKRKSLSFATRRLSGSGPSRNFLAGNWHDHALRVAVYGVARGAKRIAVRAGTLRLRARPRLNGGFLVFLPLSTRLSAVRVHVDGHRCSGSAARSVVTTLVAGATRCSGVVSEGAKGAIGLARAALRATAARRAIAH